MVGSRGYHTTYSGFGAARQPGRRTGTFLLVAALHLLAIIGIVAAFTPQIGQRAIQAGLVALDLRDSPPPPPPPPATSRPAAAAAAPGKHAVAAPIAIPSPKIAIAPPVAAPAAASTGAAVTSGARDAGAGTGAAGAGQGTGSGGSGNGTGGGQRFAKIAGAIDSARDFPIETRDQRIGTAVVVVFTVGTDGRAHACRVRDPSGDPRSDAITCRLVEERFRFRPATDAAGNPVEAQWGWRQTWHY